MAPKLLKALLICCLLQASLTSSSEVMREFVEAMDEIAVVEKQRDDYTMEAHQHLQLQRALLRAATPRHLANNNGNDDGNGSSGSVDLTKFALEYIGCSNIRSWDDDEAENKDSTSPLSMYRFVILRLCEASSCSAYNRWGCSSNYGEYMIPMEDYLQIMFNHHTTQFGYYCNLCQKCMNYNPSSSSSSYTDDANSGNDDGWSSYSQYWGTEITDDEGAADAATDDGNNAAADGDDYYSDDVVVDDAYNYDNDNNRQRNRELANQQSQPSYISDSGTCKYESVCSKYKSACQNVPENRGIEQYFSCATFPIGNNGNYGYIGPHCQSDGQTIDIGFYTDESCNNFAGESENLKNYFSIDETDMDIYTSKTCIPCSAADSFALVTDDQLNDGGIYSLCSALYEPAAKCQKAFSNQYKSYQTSQQGQNEGAVCDMIESLVTNTYDEFGDPIVLVDFDFHHWKSKSEYVNLVRKASPLQITLLIISSLLTLALALYALHLHKKIYYRTPWVPPIVSGYGNYDTRSHAGRLSRGHSGIVANRTGLSVGESSQTGGQYYAGHSTR